MGFIEEVSHTTWLANVVMVKKVNGSWKMSIHFIDLNKACLKDFYPLLNIDSLVNAALSYNILCFCDASFG